MLGHNPVLDELGFAPGDRVVIVHADDLGMCEATVDAFVDLYDGGLVSSGSVMVPCPWFPQIAARCRARDDLDVGVHLPLTSEWDSYRWGPISTSDPASGLLDDEGYFFRNQASWRRLDPAAAGREFVAQVDRARSAGLDLTHIDSHMFSMLHPSLVDAYVQLGLDTRTPVLLVRWKWADVLGESKLAALAREGMPVFDHLKQMQLTGPAGGWLDLAKRTFDELPAGLSYLIGHPAKDTPELRAIARDWRARVADYATLGDPRLAAYVRALGIEVVGWRTFRDLMRGRGPRLAQPIPGHGDAGPRG